MDLSLDSLAIEPPIVTSGSRSQSSSQHGRFTVFPALPIELQHNIWDAACLQEELEQRVLTIAPNSEAWHLRPRHPEWYHPAIVVKTNMPACLKPRLLHTCTYTRSKLSQVYVPWPCARDESFAVTDRKIWVKPQIDVFFLSGQKKEMYWFLEILRMKLHRENDDLPGLVSADQSVHACAIYGITRFAVDSELYKEYFHKVALWRPKFAGFEELWICRGNLRYLKEMGADSMEVFLHLSSRAGEWPVAVPRGAMRKRLSIAEYPSRKARDNRVGESLKLRFVGKTHPAWIDLMGTLE